GSVSLWYIRNNEQYVVKCIEIRHQHTQLTLIQVPVPYFTPAGAAHKSGFTNAVVGEVIVQIKGFVLFGQKRIYSMSILLGSKRNGYQGLRFTTGKDS